MNHNDYLVLNNYYLGKKLLASNLFFPPSFCYMVMEMFLIRYIMYLLFVLLSECSNSLVLFLFNLFPVPFESSPTYHLFGFAAVWMCVWSILSFSYICY